MRALLLVGLLLAGCASGGPPRTPMKVIDRALAKAPGVAQPGKIIAREFAFARAVRESGRASALRSLGADAASAPAGVSGTDYDARTVWMSCDATLAVSAGRYQIADDTPGTYATVWQRQRDDSYRQIAHGGVALPLDEDDDDNAPEDGAILVTGAASIEGIVADCDAGSGPALLPAMQAGPTRKGALRSGDNTLRFFCDETPGAQVLSAWYLADGAWEQAVDLVIPGAGRC